MVYKQLGQPSDDYEAVVAKTAQDSTAALAVLADPSGTQGRALLAKARQSGWAECIGELGPRSADPRVALGPLDGLLYRGEITPSEYWTASVMFGLWRDSQQPAVTADATLREPGDKVAFGGRYVRWDDVMTLDLADPQQRAIALARGYALDPLTSARHAHSVGAAACQWGNSPDRFMYWMPVNRTGTFPWFGLSVFLLDSLAPWKIQAKVGDERLPVFSLRVFQHDLKYFYKQSLTPVPRLGVDSVASLQRQVLANTRAAGISHPFPWTSKHRQVHADFLPTGEAGFAWHDLGHLGVGSAAPVQARHVLVRLHQALSAHAKTLTIPETVGIFPFRKLFMGRLFGLTDQSGHAANAPHEHVIKEYVDDIVGEPLSNHLLNFNTAKLANVQSNFVAHVPVDCLFHAQMDEELLEYTCAKLDHWGTSQSDPDIEDLANTWTSFSKVQVTFCNDWLRRNGYLAAGKVPQYDSLQALVIARHPHRARPRDAHVLNMDIGLASGQQGFKRLNAAPVPFRAMTLRNDPWVYKGQ